MRQHLNYRTAQFADGARTLGVSGFYATGAVMPDATTLLIHDARRGTDRADHLTRRLTVPFHHLRGILSNIQLLSDLNQRLESRVQVLQFLRLRRKLIGEHADVLAVEIVNSRRRDLRRL